MSERNFNKNPLAKFFFIYFLILLFILKKKTETTNYTLKLSPMHTLFLSLSLTRFKNLKYPVWNLLRERERERERKRNGKSKSSAIFLIYKQNENFLFSSSSSTKVFPVLISFVFFTLYPKATSRDFSLSL